MGISKTNFETAVIMPYYIILVRDSSQKLAAASPATSCNKKTYSSFPMIHMQMFLVWSWVEQIYWSSSIGNCCPEYELQAKNMTGMGIPVIVGLGTFGFFSIRLLTGN